MKLPLFLSTHLSFGIIYLLFNDSSLTARRKYCLQSALLAPAMHTQKVARGKMLFFISKHHPLSVLTPYSSCSTHFLDLIMGAGRVHTFSCYPGELLTQTFKKAETAQTIEERGWETSKFRCLRQLYHTASCLRYLGPVTTSVLP